MLPEIGPVLLTKHACAFWLNCYPYQVRKKLGSPDCYARIGSRDDACWLRSRVRPKFVNDEWIDDKDDGKILWSLQELARRVGVTPRFALKRLPPPVATLKNAERSVYLYREIFWVALKKDIMSGKVHVPLRSIKGRKSGVYFADPYHPLATDQTAEQQRIAKLRNEPASWARMY